VAVHVDRQADLLLERLHHLRRAKRREHARHVLDADGVRTHLLEGLGEVDVEVQRVHGAHRVGDRALEVRSGLLDGTRRHLDVARVVERVEHAEHVDAVTMGRLHEALDDLVGVVPVPDQVLAPEEHLQGRLLHVLLDDAEPVPGVLIQEAQCGVERGATPDLEGPVAHLVHLVEDGDHVRDVHPRRPERLVRVSQCRVRDTQGSHDPSTFATGSLQNHPRGGGRCWHSIPDDADTPKMRSRDALRRGGGTLRPG
jgi:hypothetical protein